MAERGCEIQRVEKKLLEDANIKISSVDTRTLGVSGRAMLEALVAGERDPGTLAALARGRLKNKNDQLIQALDGHFSDHHAFTVKLYLDHIDALSHRIESLSEHIDAVIGPLASCIDLSSTIPGVSKTVAEIVIAETGADMTQFPTAAGPTRDDSLTSHADPMSYLGIGHTLGRQQHDPGTLGQTGTNSRRPNPRRQNLFITIAEHQSRSRKMSHNPFSQTQPSNYLSHAALAI